MDERITIPGYEIEFLSSPNSSGRTVRPTLVVLHSTGGAYAGAVSWLRNKQAKVSAHYVISRAGEVVQLVPLTRVAWHAGQSLYLGRGHVNAWSVGIEYEHLDRVQDWPEAQLAAGAALCRGLCDLLNIGEDRIVGHADVCQPKGRKIDPYGFPWTAFRHQVRALAVPSLVPGIQIGETRVSGELVEDQLYVPARAAAEALGRACVFVPPVSVQIDGHVLAGRKDDGGTLWIPAGTLVRLLGLRTAWEGATKTLHILAGG